jgi:hypothetical protein
VENTVLGLADWAERLAGAPAGEGGTA